MEDLSIRVHGNLRSISCACKSAGTIAAASPGSDLPAWIRDSLPACQEISVEGIGATLRPSGAPAVCYIFSESDEIDAQEMDLDGLRAPASMYAHV